MATHILIQSESGYHYAVKKADIRRVADTVDKKRCVVRFSTPSQFQPITVSMTTKEFFKRYLK